MGGVALGIGLVLSGVIIVTEQGWTVVIAAATLHVRLRIVLDGGLILPSRRAR